MADDPGPGGFVNSKRARNQFQPASSPQQITSRSTSSKKKSKVDPKHDEIRAYDSADEDEDEDEELETDEKLAYEGFDEQTDNDVTDEVVVELIDEVTEEKKKRQNTRRKLKENEVYYTIKQGLNKFIKDKSLREPIQDLVVAISYWRYHAYNLLALHYLRLLDGVFKENEDKDIYNVAPVHAFHFVSGKVKAGLDLNPNLEETYKLYEQINGLHDVKMPIERTGAAVQACIYASQAFTTEASNNMFMHYIPRHKMWIKLKLIQFFVHAGVPILSLKLLNSVIYPIINDIYLRSISKGVVDLKENKEIYARLRNEVGKLVDVSKLVELEVVCHKLINTARQLIGSRHPERVFPVNESKLQKQWTDYLPWLRQILRDVTDWHQQVADIYEKKQITLDESKVLLHKIRLFSLIPHAQVGLCHVTVDTTVLHYLMLQVARNGENKDELGSDESKITSEELKSDKSNITSEELGSEGSKITSEHIGTREMFHKERAKWWNVAFKGHNGKLDPAYLIKVGQVTASVTYVRTLKDGVPRKKTRFEKDLEKSKDRAKLRQQTQEKKRLLKEEKTTNSERKKFDKSEAKSRRIQEKKLQQGEVKARKEQEKKRGVEQKRKDQEDLKNVTGEQKRKLKAEQKRNESVRKANEKLRQAQEKQLRSDQRKKSKLVQRRIKEETKVKLRETQTNNAWEPEPIPFVQRILPPGTLIVGLDPGKIDIFATSCGTGPKKERIHSRMSGAEYRHLSGNKKRTKKSTEWMEPIMTARKSRGQNQISNKVASTGALLEYFKSIAIDFSQLWEIKSNPRQQRLKFDAYIKSAKALDIACKRILTKPLEKSPNGQKFVVAFGQARFNGTKGCPTAPTKRLYERLTRCYKDKCIVMDTDEFRTSSMCHTCGDQLVKVSGPSGLIYSLKACQKCFTVFDRDDLGATNIALACQAFNATGKPPHHLRRGRPAIKADMVSRSSIKVAQMKQNKKLRVTEAFLQLLGVGTV